MIFLGSENAYFCIPVLTADKKRLDVLKLVKPP